MLSLLVFFLGLTAIVAITALSIAPLLIGSFEFWPPPGPKSWQHKVFRLLFRIFFVCLIVLSIVDFNSSDLWRFVLGGGLLGIGFGFALSWTGFLGWKNAFGDATGLKTKAFFQVSRSPIYLVSIIGMIGWALLVNSDPLTGLLFFWAVLYVGAPFVEEPWMRRRYGNEYGKYASKVPRYISLKEVLSPLELKVPPAVIVIASAGNMYWLAQMIWHEELLHFPLRLLLYILIEVLAIGILLAALKAFRIHETTMNPLVPNNASNVVRSGVYQYTRNPMYLSMFCVLLGWAILLGQLSTLAALPLYVYLITRLQIIPEEEILLRKFADEYRRYGETTSRWLSLP